MALTEGGVKLIVSQMLQEFRGTFGDEVQEKLVELKSTIQVSIERDVGAILKTQIDQANDLTDKLKLNSDAVMIEVASALARCAQNVADLNRTIDDAKAKFVEIEEQRIVAQSWSVSIGAALAETSPELEAKINAWSSAAHADNQSVKEFVQTIEERIRRTGVAGGAGTGADVTSIKTRLNAKDCLVQKLSEKADVLEFRQWMKMIKLQLESCHAMIGIEKVTAKLRFMTGSVDAGFYDSLFDEIHSDVNASGQPSGPLMCAKAEWGFEDKGRF